MPDFDVQSKLNRILVLAAYRQAAWATALPDASMTRIQRFDGSAVPDYGNERRSDAGMSGKGTSFATNSQATMRSLKLSGLKMEATDWNVAWALGFLMGRVVTTGNAVPYSHAITFDESTRSAVPTSVYMQDTADIAAKLLDMFVTTATLTIAAKGSITLEVDMLGTGRETDGVLAQAPTIPDENYLMGNDTVCTWGAVGAPVSIAGRFMSGTVKFESQSTVHEAPGGGTLGIFGRRGDPKFSLELVIAAKEIDDVLTRFKADQKTALVLTTNSGANCQLIISVPASNLKATKMGFDGDMPIWNVSIDETTSYKVGNVQPITVTVISSQPTFLTVPA